MRMLLGALTLGLALTVPAVHGQDFKPEPGFKLISNGKDLSPWKEASYKKQDEKTDLTGKTVAANKRFVLAKDIVTIDEKVKGDMCLFTVEEFGKDATVRFDFKPGEKCNNDLLWRGMKFDINVAQDYMKNAKLNEWNTMEIVVTGKKADFKVNGESAKTLDTKSDSSAFGIRAESGPLQFKNFRVKSGS